MSAELDGLRGLVTGRLRLGVTPLLGDLDLASVVAGFRRAHPGLSIGVRTDLTSPLIEELEGGGLDVVVGPAERATAGRLQVDVLAEETVVLICPPTLDLSGLDEAGEQDVISLPAPVVCAPSLMPPALLWASRRGSRLKPPRLPRSGSTSPQASASRWLLHP